MRSSVVILSIMPMPGAKAHIDNPSAGKTDIRRISELVG